MENDSVGRAAQGAMPFEQAEEAREEIESRLGSSSPSMEVFEPLHTQDAVILKRLASNFSRTQTSIQRTPTIASSLQREKTLDTLDPSDETINPDSQHFDLSKYLRMTMRSFENESISPASVGVLFKNLTVRGSGSAINIRDDIGCYLTALGRIGSLFSMHRKPQKQILRSFNGLVKSGELLLVLGRPGSGCSTLLKTVTGEMHGLDLDSESVLHYNGISQRTMRREFGGEIVYNQENDTHFPHLTVGETLEHAAALRVPNQRPQGVSREELVKHIVQVVMAIFGLTHTYNTKVGNDFVRGVSGGERKRVSIAEMALAGSAFGSWDNSTRGLDSATALLFVKALRLTASIIGKTHAVAVYQASEAIYELFDRVTVLYSGRQIYFGPANQARQFFEAQGWHCPQRQTTGDFLTSVTNPSERTPREGFESKVPRTPEEFEAYWLSSNEFAALQKEMRDHEQEYPQEGEAGYNAMHHAQRRRQVKSQRQKSPYVVSVATQVRLNARRAYQRRLNDKPSTLTPIIGNIIMALIIGSVFYGTPNATAGFTSKGSALFFAILLNALSAIAEINSLYSQRPIVEKHASYAFYHPWTEAMAGIVLDIPIKFVQAVVFNLILYFMAGLRRDAASFFIFLLTSYVASFVMAAVFRTIAATTKTISQAMAFAGTMVLAIVVYTGFTVPVPYMHPWFSWIRFINPVFYAFEMLVVTEFHGRDFTCSQFVPSYPVMSGDAFICAMRGAVTGERRVSGDAYIAASYQYDYSHLWRNFGILIAFLVGFTVMYLVATELNSSTASQAEALVFLRGHIPPQLLDNGTQTADQEKAGTSDMSAQSDLGKSGEKATQRQDIFAWRDVVYDIEIKGEPRRLLDHVSGWVKPGTLTALMGTSGAGKTTLLDALAQRTTTGVITGSMLVNGNPIDAGFQRSTGYVQQQDLHLETATVRESLRFSAMLRRPSTVTREEKYQYVERVIEMLGMTDFAEAIVGNPGEGLNVEQRKLLTIGVELAAKPDLLLFLDEPTSGLDSQSSWAICTLLRRLADEGQAILCTIHQPSAILFQQFDRLLFLRKGGKTVYFGDIGENSRTLLDYFHRSGARACSDDENPAEYMLEIIGQDTDWQAIWNESAECKAVNEQLDELQTSRLAPTTTSEGAAHMEFAMPFSAQLYEVGYRTAQQYWRMPAYITAKCILSTAAGLFIGFTFFDADSSLQGMQNVLYSLFMISSIFSTVVQQIMPQFVLQRSLFEARERPSKAYSWKAFLIASLMVEWPYQIFAGILVFATFYYPVVGIQSSEQQGLVLILCIVFMIYASTFAHLCIVALPDAQTAGSIVTLLFTMTLTFNGVMQSPTALPGFWIFMYRVSPFTYWVAGMADAVLHARPVICSATETSIFNPPEGLTCGAYLEPFLQLAPGTLQNPADTFACRYCSLSNADQFLAGVNIYWSQRWRNFGLFLIYIAFNLVAIAWLYWFFRARKLSGRKSPSLSQRLRSMVEGVRNMHRQQARTNRFNHEAF